MGREALSTEVWLQGTCSDVQLHRLGFIFAHAARAGGHGELSIEYGKIYAVESGYR